MKYGTATMHIGDALTVLRGLPSESVHCCVTSPPYWGLRDYGTGTWEGGDPDCKHEGSERYYTEKTAARSSAEAFSEPGEANAARIKQGRWREVGACRHCGAVRVDQQIGLEPTPAEHIARLVEVFEEVRRVLRADGVLWLNYGDAYAAHPGQRKDTDAAGPKQRSNTASVQVGSRSCDCLKPKDLIGLPWRLAFALQEAGWWLRCDVIWAKPNPMPESVTDRPTRSHEYLFLLAKSERYFYDADAVREAASDGPKGGRQRAEADGWCYDRTAGKAYDVGRMSRLSSTPGVNALRNRRSVWSIPTESFPEAHFATFPRDLVRPCILAGTSERGCCPECGAPWRRVTGRACEACGVLIATQGKRCQACGHVHDWRAERATSDEYGTVNWSTPGKATPRKLNGSGKQAQVGQSHTVGEDWTATCACGHEETAPCTVLDPFAGSATVGVVALEYGRDFIGIELSPEYTAMAERRLATVRGQGVMTL